MSEIEKLRAEMEEHARKNGFRLNPNKAIVDNNLKMLLEREKELGARYCPCRRPTGDKEEDKKIICPCVYHKDEIREQGHCHCLLFVAGEKKS